MNDFLAHIDLVVAVQALQIGAGLVMAITAAEMLVRFGAYANSGILSWELGRLMPAIAQRPWRQRLGDIVYTEQRFKLLFVLRLLVGLGMVACGALSVLSSWLIAPALLSSLLVVYRAGPGQDGSFQLRILILAVLLSCSISPVNSLTFRIGLYFLSLQLILSYLIAGIAKLRGLTWRDGTGLIGIFGTVYHGNIRVYKLLAGRKTLSQVLSWGVIAFEVLFPLVLMGQGAWVMSLLAFTTLFHLATSFLMGLNGFFLSFVAAYPTLIFCLGELPWASW